MSLSSIENNFKHNFILVNLQIFAIVIAIGDLSPLRNTARDCFSVLQFNFSMTSEKKYGRYGVKLVTLARRSISFRNIS